MQERKIFRSKAMESLSSPDEYDEPVKIVSVKSWVLFLLLFCASTAFITWVLFSNVNQEVRCIGIHLIPDRIYEVNSLSSGLIKRITAAKNTRIKAGDTLVEFISASTKEKAAILSAVDGSIFELNITAGDFINAGDKLMRIKKETGERNSRNSEISVFVPANSVGKIKKGGEVLISAASTDTKDPGFLSGRVSSVAEFPLSKERIGFLLKQFPLLAGQITEEFYEVTVLPQKQKQQLNSEGGEGSENLLSGDGLCDVRIITGQKKVSEFISN